MHQFCTKKTGEPVTLKAIDKFAAANEKIGRPEAIRRLVELGLKAKGGKR